VSKKLRSLIILLIGAGLAYWFVSQLEWQIVSAHLRHMRIWPLVVAALLINLTTVARSLRTRRSHSVGVLIPDLNNPLFPPIVRGIEDRLAAAGYVALIGNTDGDAERERTLFEQMRARHVDGLVLATVHLGDPLLAESARADLPVVLMNRLAHDYSLPSVSVDNERGIRMAVAHLASLGHTRIAHIAGPQEVSTGLARYRGFIAAMEAHGLAADPELIVTAKSFSIDEGLRCAQLLLTRDGGCTAVAAGNDMLAIGCYAALDQAGLSCPEDLSVIGFNDMPFIDRLRPPLTTIRFPHYQVGTEAAQLLGVSVATVKRRLYRSLQLLTEKLADLRPGIGES